MKTPFYYLSRRLVATNNPHEEDLIRRLWLFNELFRELGWTLAALLKSCVRFIHSIIRARLKRNNVKSD